MTRTTKQKQEALEELLEVALVPEEEQPYEIPENWVWVRTGGLHEIVTGSTPSKKNTEYYGGIFPFVKPGDLDQGDSVIEASEYLTDKGKDACRIIPKHSTLVCCIGSIGKTGFNLVECTTNQQINSLVPNKDLIYPKFTYYFSLSPTYQNLLLKSSSSTTVSIINKSKVSMLPFVLPPLNEQILITKKVECLFTKIDEAKLLIEEVKEDIKFRQSAILDKAFIGDLTKDWRIENNALKTAEELLIEVKNEKEIFYNQELEESILQSKKRQPKPKKFNNNFSKENLREIPSSWTYCTLGDIVYDFKYGSSAKSDYHFNGTPVLRIPNIGDYWINSADLKYLNEDVEDQGHLIRTGDILIVRSNGSKDLVGKCSIVTEKEASYAYASYLIRIRPIKVLSEYVLWLLKSEEVKNQFFSKSKSSAGINNINTEELATTIIPLPPIQEQREIVKKINQLMEIEENNIENTNIDFNLMKQGILSKAFRGKLGTNDPTEEGAINQLRDTLNFN